MGLLRSFIQSAHSTSPFPLNNLPYGVCKRRTEDAGRVCVALGDKVVDLYALSLQIPQVFDGGCLDGAEAASIFGRGSLNPFLERDRPTWTHVRERLQDALSIEPRQCTLLLDDYEKGNREIIVDRTEVEMIMPLNIGDYTDFYSSKRHAMNVGTMFRGADNALTPNWLHMPIAYHGRASSVVVSGTPIRRPCGQLLVGNDKTPQFGACKLLDFELEMATVIGGKGNKLGERVPVDEAMQHVFGLTLMNDWSARDIQEWEYVPLGPFGKCFLFLAKIYVYMRAHVSLSLNLLQFDW